MIIAEKQVKSVLTKSKLPESEYVINPYIGCTHRCGYCYARFMRRFSGHTEEWGTFLDIKVNADQILKRQLSRFNPNTGTILLGSVTDCYQPIERELKLTRRLLYSLLERGCKISILTKSDLVLRDLDLLSQFKFCSVGISVSFADDNIRKIIEPGASPIGKRFDALKTLHSAGVRTYAFVGPVFPVLTNLTDIFSNISPYVDEVWGEALNLKCGCREDITNLLLKILSPKEVENIFLLNKDIRFWEHVERTFSSLCNEHHIQFVGFFKH